MMVIAQDARRVGSRSQNTGVCLLLVILCWLVPVGGNAGEKARPQPPVRVLSVACSTATGSTAALDSLTKLREQAESAEVLQAIAACEGHYKSLRERENALWDQAVAARDRSDCVAARSAFQQLYDKRSGYQRQARDELAKLAGCGSTPRQRAQSGSNEARTLQRAVGAFNAKDFDQARVLARSLEATPGSVGDQARNLLQRIDDLERNNRRYREALIAITRRQNDHACQILSEIETSDPSFVGLADLRGKAGGCSPPVKEPDVLKARYDAATLLLRSGRLREARAAFRQIRARDAGYRDVSQVLARIDEELRSAAANPVSPLPNKIERAINDLMGKGDYRAALVEIVGAQSARPRDDRLQELRRWVETAMEQEEKQVLAGLDAFYAGRYRDVPLHLTPFLNDLHTPRLLALSRFYIAAAALSLYHLGGASDEALRVKSLQMFEELRRTNPDFVPPLHAVSAKIQAAFKQTGTGTR